mmetsp:Transcript_375/g.321  ORF Transcript_375/g.321 Transcript_375/m.321 type:complete len:192 (-) Transcript_375:1218-1793(-)
MRFDNFEDSMTSHNEFFVCTDEQRLQQVIMNVLSNSLKFTPQGGSVLISAKHIAKLEDLNLTDFAGNLQTSLESVEEVVKTARHGCIQISIEDSGIGIAVDNQLKLFKLFGFLDVTEELNTHGIGLGLHISKKITQQFGGNIVCVSEWKKGSKFVFLFALDAGQDFDTGVRRCRNPIQRFYPKVKFELTKF